MPKYRVVALQRVIDEATVEVEAPDEETARAVAIEQADALGEWDCIEVQASWVDHLEKLEDPPTKEKRPVCDNCDTIFEPDDVDVRYPDIPRLLERLESGGEVPFGECPGCGALVYLAEITRSR